MSTTTRGRYAALRRRNPLIHRRRNSDIVVVEHPGTGGTTSFARLSDALHYAHETRGHEVVHVEAGLEA